MEPGFCRAERGSPASEDKVYKAKRGSPLEELSKLFEMWWVYILNNEASGKFYIGTTSNIKERLIDHSYSRKKRWTGRQHGEWKLVHKELFENKTEALIKEKAIKRQKSRKYIERLIKAGNNYMGSSISPV